MRRISVASSIAVTIFEPADPARRFPLATSSRSIRVPLLAFEVFMVFASYRCFSACRWSSSSNPFKARATALASLGDRSLRSFLPKATKRATVP